MLFARSRRETPLATAVAVTVCWMGALTVKVCAQPPVELVDFSQDIQPILQTRCVKCHGVDRQRSGLRLVDRASALQGGESGKPAILPGQSARSRLIQLVTSQDASQRMPFREEPLNKGEIALLTRWIDAGAPWPEGPANSEAGTKGPVQYPDSATAILFAKCVDCHGAASQMGALRLDSKTAVLRGGASGPAAVSGNGVESLIVKLVTAADPKKRMPLGGSLDSSEIAILRSWIDRGMPWSATSALPSRAPEEKELVVRKEDRRHWAFLPLPSSVSVPPVKNTVWPRTPIDRFILAAQEKKALSPASEASRRDQIRRAFLDLLGLPPTPEDVKRFLADPAPDAYERLVDRLLTSPHYGERWARHWLDLARYADSDGYESDRDRNEAYPYRDFVIRAFNEDMPYNQFVQWQIAGDELEPDEPAAIAATGFITAGPNLITAPTDSKKNKEKYRYDELDDYVATTGTALLGLTVGCARCHDHKYDPIPTRDYYRVVASFANSQREINYLSRPYRELKDFLDTARASLRDRKMEEIGIPEDDRDLLRVTLFSNNPTQRKLYQKFDKSLQFTEEELRASLTSEQKQTLQRLEKAVRQADGQQSAPPMALMLRDRAAVAPRAYLLGRGDPENKREELQPGFLTVLTGAEDPTHYLAAARERAEAPTTSYQRAALAGWLTDVDEGAGRLLARVIVNRLWYHHLGEGLVRTLGDFGIQGDAPSHAELLDWLARELIRNGWRLKPLHRLIMTSAVYRQATDYDETKSKLDPENRVWWRRRPVRLEAEALRDALLHVSGGLNPQMYGPGFKPPLPKEAMATRSKDPYPSEAKDSPELYRRSIYMFTKRSVRHPMMEAFDGADVDASCSRRVTTVVPTQALTLMNDDFVRRRAGDLAHRLQREAGDSRSEQIVGAFELLFARPPSEAELRESMRFLKKQGSAEQESAETSFGPLRDLCHSLFLLNEFSYVN